MSGVREMDMSQRYIEMGARFVLVTSDVPLLLEAGKARTEAFREFENSPCVKK